MGIESTSEVWESTRLFVGRSAGSCGQGVGEGVAKRHAQDGSFGALQPPATMGAARKIIQAPFFFTVDNARSRMPECMKT